MTQQHHIKHKKLLIHGLITGFILRFFIRKHGVVGFLVRFVGILLLIGFIINVTQAHG